MCETWLEDRLVSTVPSRNDLSPTSSIDLLNAFTQSRKFLVRRSDVLSLVSSFSEGKLLFNASDMVEKMRGKSIFDHTGLYSDLSHKCPRSSSVSFFLNIPLCHLFL